MGQFNSFPIPTNTFAAYTSFINIKDFGAVGDGIHDDTAAINAAYATLKGSSGTVLWPPGNYKTTDSIRIGDTTSGASAPQSEISTLATGGADFGTQISYAGPTDRPAVIIGRNPYSRFEGLLINNVAGSRGTTTGLVIGGSGTGASGTQCYSCLFHNVHIGNFSTAISDGNSGAFSECTFLSCSITNCDLGYTQTDFNTLDNMFINISCSGCTIGITNGAAENIAIYGGSSSANGTDFYAQQNAQVFIIENFRSENATGVNVLGDLGGAAVVIRNCMFKDQSPQQGKGMAIRGIYRSLSVQDSFLHGWIFLEQPGRFLEVRNSYCLTDPNTGYPFVISGLAVGNADGFHMLLKQNRDTFNALAIVPDFEGIIKNNVISTQSPFNGGQAILPVWTKTKWQIPPTNVGAPYGLDTNLLSHVRQLAEGPQPGVFVPPPVTTLTANAATAAGNNVLHFAATTGVVVGMQVQDTTNAVIPNPSYVTQVATTTITINNNVTGGGVVNGDTIKFQAGVAALTPGNNLRVQGKFASSGSLAFTFVRNQSVTCNTSSTIVAAAGQFFPADVGKPIELPGFATLPGWSNWFGAITTYVDSTHVTVLAGGSNNPGNGTVTATIGQNEPDGNYMVLVTGNANETFWVDTISSTGFTVHSSNAASTATVTCLIVR